MEIQVGEYVRTDKGNIGKLVEIRCGESEDGEKLVDVYFLDNGIWTLKKYIIKHSFNIIDLIEVGDVIRYKELASNEKYGTIVNQIYISDIHSEDELNFIKEEVDRNAIKILSIVTKEQFESIKYEV